MTIYELSTEPLFPPADHAEDEGLLAIGGDLSPPRLIAAYASGIFPWPHRGMPLLWFSPDPRMVLMADEVRVSRSLRQVLRRGRFEIRLDTAFRQVMQGCAAARRKGARGTWINREMIEAYTRMHEMGFAHSAEAWHEGKLVGGLYGVSIGRAFFGESMFTTMPNASKAAFATLVGQLDRWGIRLIDCQTHTDHLERLGARLVPRAEFLALLAQAVREEAPPTPWLLDAPRIAT